MADPSGSNAGVQDEVAARLRDALGEAAETRSRAEAVARAVDGVTYVINNLRVAQEGTTGATG